MAWIEVHQSLPTHPKTLEAAMLLEVSEVAVVGHIVCLWLWALDARQDGHLDITKPRVLARAAQWDKEPGRFVDALIAVGFLDTDGAIHDWDDYTGRLMERRERINEQTRVRMRAYRDRRRLSSLEAPVTQGVTRNKLRSYAPTVPNPTVPNQSPTTPLKGSTREAGASPPPKTGGNQKVAAVIDALRAEGMTGTLNAKDRAAILRTEHDPAQVAALYAAIFRGEYPPSGDQFFLDNLSVWFCLEKMPGWLAHRAGHHAPARKNGKPLRGGAAIDALWEETHGQERGGSRGPAVGHEEAGGGVPRQLRG